jgi:hypothetical protein
VYSPSDSFGLACSSFLESLSDECRAKFAAFKDADSMLEDLHQLALNHPAQKSRLMMYCARVKSLASILGPYFDVVGILVQANPEYAGVTWGALRLIFVVGLSIYPYCNTID